MILFLISFTDRTKIRIIQETIDILMRTKNNQFN